MTESLVASVAALRELLEQRTPGRWEAKPFDRQPDLAILISWEELGQRQRSRRAKPTSFRRHHIAGFFKTADAHLVELAISVLPDLLADYERLLAACPTHKDPQETR